MGPGLEEGESDELVRGAAQAEIQSGAVSQVQILLGGVCSLLSKDLGPITSGLRFVPLDSWKTEDRESHDLLICFSPTFADAENQTFERAFAMVLHACDAGTFQACVGTMIEKCPSAT